MPDSEADRLIYQAEQLKRLSEHVMKEAMKLREEAARLIEHSKTLRKTEVNPDRVN